VFELEPYDAIADSVVPEPSVRCNEEAAYTWLGVVLHQGLSWVSQSEDHVSIIRAKILKVIKKKRKYELCRAQHRPPPKSILDRLTQKLLTKTEFTASSEI
jgi:hypothetical protein